MKPPAQRHLQLMPDQAGVGTAQEMTELSLQGTAGTDGSSSNVKIPLYRTTAANRITSASFTAPSYGRHLCGYCIYRSEQIWFDTCIGREERS